MRPSGCEGAAERRVMLSNQQSPGRAPDGGYGETLCILDLDASATSTTPYCFGFSKSCLRELVTSEKANGLLFHMNDCHVHGALGFLSNLSIPCSSLDK